VLRLEIINDYCKNRLFNPKLKVAKIKHSNSGLKYKKEFFVIFLQEVFVKHKWE